MAAIHVTEFVRGDDWEFTGTIAAGTPPVPVDLTGCTIASQLRPEPDSKTIILDWEITVLDETAGLVKFTADNTATTTVPAGEPLAWDIEVIDPAGNKQTYIAGSTFTTQADVTR